MKTAPAKGNEKAVVEENAEEVKKSLLKVLSGCNVIIESTDADAETVRAKLFTYGARIVKAVTTGVLCIISTEGEAPLFSDLNE